MPQNNLRGNQMTAEEMKRWSGGWVLWPFFYGLSVAKGRESIDWFGVITPKYTFNTFKRVSIHLSFPSSSLSSCVSLRRWRVRICSVVCLANIGKGQMAFCRYLFNEIKILFLLFNLCLNPPFNPDVALAFKDCRSYRKANVCLLGSGNSVAAHSEPKKNPICVVVKISLKRVKLPFSLSRTFLVIRWSISEIILMDCNVLKLS